MGSRRCLTGADARRIEGPIFALREPVGTLRAIGGDEVPVVGLLGGRHNDPALMRRALRRPEGDVVNAIPLSVVRVKIDLSAWRDLDGGQAPRTPWLDDVLKIPGPGTTRVPQPYQGMAPTCNVSLPTYPWFCATTVDNIRLVPASAIVGCSEKPMMARSRVWTFILVA
jgi:hypothetical protein